MRRRKPSVERVLARPVPKQPEVGTETIAVVMSNMMDHILIQEKICLMNSILQGNFSESSVGVKVDQLDTYVHTYMQANIHTIT